MATYSDEDKLKIFKNELEDIQDTSLRVFAQNIILSAPDYFFTCPASSTGKYHPVLSLGEGGLIRHTRLVEWFAMNIANAMSIEEHNRDLLIISALAHDMKKHGDGNTEYTVKDHPKLAAEFIDGVWNSMFHKEGIEYGEIQKIERLVECHMGVWGEKDGMPVPKTKLELILHTADYLASRKDMGAFQFRPTEDVEKIEEPVSEYRITFGKHKGKTLGQFYDENPDIAVNYFEWVVGNEEFKIIEAKDKIKQFLDEANEKLKNKQEDLQKS